jgi:hypothetical protein
MCLKNEKSTESLWQKKNVSEDFHSPNNDCSVETYRYLVSLVVLNFEFLSLLPPTANFCGRTSNGIGGTSNGIGGTSNGIFKKTAKLCRSQHY